MATNQSAASASGPWRLLNSQHVTWRGVAGPPVFGALCWPLRAAVPRACGAKMADVEEHLDGRPLLEGHGTATASAVVVL